MDDPSGEANSVRFDLVTPYRLVTAVRRFLDCTDSHVVHFLAAEPTIKARRDPTYRDLLNRADLNVSDGMSVVWALRLLGRPAYRLTASDGMELVCRWGVRRNLRHYLYGGLPEVVQSLRQTLETKYPGIQIVGVHSPPFRPPTDSEMEEMANRVRQTNADVLWIALGVPKQTVVAEQLRARGSAPVVCTVGAAFDFVSGAKRRAPAWMQKRGLEWLHRLAQEPRRLWRRYLIGNARFVAFVGVDYVRHAANR